MLLHVPAPVGALLGYFAVLVLVSLHRRWGDGGRGLAVLVAAWVGVGTTSAVVWWLWRRVDPDASEPASLTLVGTAATAATAVVAAWTLAHVVRRRRVWQA